MKKEKENKSKKSLGKAQIKPFQLRKGHGFRARLNTLVDWVKEVVAWMWGHVETLGTVCQGLIRGAAK